MSRKVIVRLKGGLGNQLFCYAAARRLAWINNAELVLDTVTGFKYDYQYRRSYALNAFQIPMRLATPSEQMEPLGRLRRFMARKIAEFKPFNQRRYIQQVGVDFDPRILTLSLQDGATYFDAFGQSELYFADIFEQLQEDLIMVAPTDKINLEIARQIEATVSVATHVRWFDDGDADQTSNMSTRYYACAINQLIAKIGCVHFFIFSDQPEKTVTFLEPLMQGHPFTVVRHNGDRNVEADFWLMRQCKHFIIGNSTFAWWAAWLGEHRQEGVNVFAPRCNVNPELSPTAWGFPGLLPERWIAL